MDMSPLRAFTTVEPLGMLAFLCGAGWMVVERVLVNERRLLAVSHELATAQRIQQSILPHETPQVSGAVVAARYLPMSEVAGDFYDFLGTGPQGFGVLVADVSGHGVPAAIIASMVKVALAAEADHATDPGSLLGRMNRALCGKFDMAYVTAVYGWIDSTAGTLVYAAAGHPPLLVRRAGGRIEALEERGFVLGFDPGSTYAAGTAALSDGDCVLFYTDGLTDAEAPGGEFFGDRQLGERLSNRSPASAAQLLDGLLADVRSWTGPGDGGFADDITMVVVQIGPSPLLASSHAAGR